MTMRKQQRKIDSEVQGPIHKRMHKLLRKQNIRTKARQERPFVADRFSRWWSSRKVSG